MTSADGNVDWRELREFVAVDLTKSFVLSCEMQSETLLLDVDLFLEPEHPFYEKPRPAQKVCIRPAVIEFPYCESLKSDRVGSDAGPKTVAAAVGPGAIDGFMRLADGRYEISGEFGVIRIDSERPLLRLKGP